MNRESSDQGAESTLMEHLLELRTRLVRRLRTLNHQERLAVGGDIKCAHERAHCVRIEHHTRRPDSDCRFERDRNLDQPIDLPEHNRVALGSPARRSSAAIRNLPFAFRLGKTGQVQLGLTTLCTAIKQKAT